MGSVWLQLRKLVVPEINTFKLINGWISSRYSSTDTGKSSTSSVKDKKEDNDVSADEKVDVLDASSVLEEGELVGAKYSLETLKKFKFDTYPYYVEREWWKEGSRMTFWATWRMLRDVKRRRAVVEYGPDRLRLKCLKFNTILPQAVRDECAETLHNLPKYSCPKLVLNMCQFTGRRRGKIKRFRLNRHLFRKFADHGQLSGVQRAMW